ncbi:hypothetical protein Tco_0827508 [Tanacetum coccineum]
MVKGKEGVKEENEMETDMEVDEVIEEEESEFETDEEVEEILEEEEDDGRWAGHSFKRLAYIGPRINPSLLNV